MKRAADRLGAAAVRAVSGVADAEFQAQQLRVGVSVVPLASPYVTVDLTEAPQAQRRGVADALGLLLKHSDRSLHRELSPEPIFERLLFDILEQLRCEALASPHLVGLRSNMHHSFHQWCETARTDRLHESEAGLLVYTLIHMVRNRLIEQLDSEEDEGIIEAPRSELSPIIGESLRAMQDALTDQRLYAASALVVARMVALVAEEDEGKLEGPTETVARLRLQIPNWEEQNDKGHQDALPGVEAGGASSLSFLATAGGYSVFTTAHDGEVTGESLYRAEQRAELRERLDEHVAAQAVSIPRLARFLQLRLAAPEPDGWRFGADDGLLDPRRLSQLVASPLYQHVWRNKPPTPLANSAVTFLIDNSGSMKAQRYESVAVLADTLARALDRIGVPTEVLGFSTGAWNGGRPLTEWHAAGRPEHPGRLTELQHIVYKSADSSWKRSRLSLASMLRTTHYRESVDGEALLWAAARLVKRPEERKILIVISDGAPNDASTANANGPELLGSHLRDVAWGLARRPGFELRAIGIADDLTDVYPESIHLDLDGTLALSSYGSVLELFSQHR